MAAIACNKVQTRKGLDDLDTMQTMKMIGLHAVFTLRGRGSDEQVFPVGSFSMNSRCWRLKLQKSRWLCAADSECLQQDMLHYFGWLIFENHGLFLLAQG